VALKVYTLGINGFAPRNVLDLLGEPQHIRQARVLIVAPTKTAAFHLAQDRHIGYTTLRDPEFRLACGNDMDGLREAGRLERPAIYVLPLNGGMRSPVAVLDADGPRIVGHLTGGAFVPEADQD
jgi:hypothetical protein